MTLFCIVTLIIILSTPCASKGEEIFDTLILVARNVVQFWRLAAIMRRLVYISDVNHDILKILLFVLHPKVRDQYLCSPTTNRPISFWRNGH